MSVLKTKPTQNSVQEFIEQIENSVQKSDCKLLLAWMSEISGKTPQLWSHHTVGFGEYQYSTAKGIAKWYLMGFSPRKQNISIHIMTGYEKFPELMEKLGKFKTGKSCLYINKLEHVDTVVLREIIEISWKKLQDFYPPLSQ
ncbi:MAG: DUF1801 domain-containing protein [Flavobacteriales bacterium]|nr:DUF1801 domain-containing protein [Flavobacteriales bacterium]